MSIRVGLRHMARILWKKVLPPKAEYGGSVLKGGYRDMAQFVGVVAEVGIPSGPAQWCGVTSLGGNSLFAQFGGVTVELGTVT